MLYGDCILTPQAEPTPTPSTLPTSYPSFDSNYIANIEVTTFTGTGNPVSPSLDGNRSTATFTNPYSACLHPNETTIYVAQSGVRPIRQIDTISGLTTTVPWSK